MFTQEQIQKLKTNINIEEFYTSILGNDITYKCNDKGYTICCPFHDDKNPSFSIIKESGIWRCWSEGIHGDIIDFYSRFYGKSFKDSVLEMAERFNINIELSEEMKFQLRLRDATIALNTNISKYYHSNLLKYPESIQYLKSRRIDSNTVTKFQLGYTGNESLKDLYPKNKKLLYMSNLAYENGNNYFSDKRITIPFHDDYGRIIGFSTRAIEPNMKPKYLHSKASEVFDKSDCLFGYCFAKDTIKEVKSIIIVEGQFDCIRAHQFGITNCVAVTGNALTDKHVVKVKNNVKNFYIVVEDKAFEKDRLDATYETIIKNHWWATVKVVRLYENEKCDLDDYLLKNGKMAFLELIKNAPLYNEYKLQDVIKNINYKNLEDKKAHVYKCRKYINNIKNSIDKREYIRLISNTLELPVNDIYNIITKENKEEVEIGVYDDRITLSQKMIISSLFSKFSKTREGLAETYCILERLNVEEKLDKQFKTIYELIVQTYLHNTDSCDIINTLYINKDINPEIMKIITDCYFKGDELDTLEEYKDLELMFINLLGNLE